ncbi:MAG: acetyl-CoA carboxylase biotin carboxyl carrier protein [Alphaproteobacteria bacterium GM202ARS2]|nr:acetyl-CoA carboxylase biotin carboxyl carrier protein [Alphaproteobacteria bacterium GM202ARS2]
MSKDKPASINSEHVRILAQLLQETDLSEIEYETESLRIRVAKKTHVVTSSAAVASLPPPASAKTPDAPESPPDGTVIKAPLVGTVYRAPEPGAPPFINEGDTVKKGDTLLIIEAMKTMNPVRAPASGTITAILVTDGAPIEYGEQLVIMTP